MRYYLMRPLVEFLFGTCKSLIIVTTVLPDFKSGQIFQVTMVRTLLFAAILIGPHKVIKGKKRKKKQSLYCAVLPSQEGAHLSIL